MWAPANGAILEERIIAGTGHQEVCHRRYIVRSGTIAVLLYQVKAQAWHVSLKSARQELDIGATPCRTGNTLAFAAR
ncbi:hypothetical protein M5G07_01305 [Serratia symbiotica]|nr:hypothetical protein [Serratia symbiotica]